MFKKYLFIFVIIFSFTLLISKAEATISSSLSLGSKGAQVKELQQILTKSGYYTGKVDSSFNSGVKSSVIKFQIANKISPASGVVNAATRAKLNKLAISSKIINKKVSPVVIKKLLNLPKTTKAGASVNDVGTVTLKKKLSFFEKLFPVAYATGTSRIFLYKSGSLPNQLYYYDLTTGEKKQLSSENKMIFSASILDQVNSVIYSIPNTDSGVTLKLFSLDNSSVKTISTNALGPINFTLGPDGKSFAYFELEGNDIFLVVKDLNSSSNPTITLKQKLPDGVGGADLAWSSGGQSVYIVKRSNPYVSGPEEIVEFDLNDQSIKKIVDADSYKSWLSVPLMDGRLFYVGLTDITNPGNSLFIFEKDTVSGSTNKHSETLGATNYLVSPNGGKIYFNAASNSADPVLANYWLVGFGQSSQELILDGYARCEGSSCSQTFYSYDVSTQVLKDLFINQFTQDQAGPQG